MLSILIHAEQKLARELPPELLSPSDNKMMNRISSSIIRELSSNMLIPYTRLKLLECVGQGQLFTSSATNGMFLHFQ